MDEMTQRLQALLDGVGASHRSQPADVVERELIGRAQAAGFDLPAKNLAAYAEAIAEGRSVTVVADKSGL